MEELWKAWQGCVSTPIGYAVAMVAECLKKEEMDNILSLLDTYTQN